MISCTNKEKWEQEMYKLQEPIQHIVMGMISVLKNQRKEFSDKELWLIYLGCIKKAFDKDFETLTEDTKDVK